MVGAAEINLDPETGEVQVVDYAAAVDCGTVINPALARVQTEGGIVQGIGMALYEDVWYNADGRMVSDSLMQYKIPSRLDVGTIRVELVINTPAPAILGAILNATGVAFHTLPVRPEDIAMAQKPSDH